MAQSDLGAVAPASTPGSYPIGDTGWQAGDFQNGSGLLGLVPPAYLSGQGALGDGSTPPTIPGGLAPSGPFPLGDTGWMAGDLQSGSGLLGLTPPPSGAHPGPTGVNSWSALLGAGNPVAQSVDSPSTDDDETESPDNAQSDDNDDQPDNSVDADEPSPAAAQIGQSGVGGGASQGAQDAHLDYGLATPGDAQFDEVVASRTLRGQWERLKGMPWPKTEDGQNYHVHHIVAKADGGADHVSNIEPMHPDEHRAMHMANGDFSRWANEWWARVRGNSPTPSPAQASPNPAPKTQSASPAKASAPPPAKASSGPILKAPSGSPSEPSPGITEEPGIGALGLFGLLPTITGLLSGRIRTDNFEHFTNDVTGIPYYRDATKSDLET